MHNTRKNTVVIGLIVLVLFLLSISSTTYGRATQGAGRIDPNAFLCSVQVLCKFDLVNGNTEGDATGSAVILSSSVEQSSTSGSEYMYKLLTCAHVLSPALIYSLPPENYAIYINIPISEKQDEVMDSAKFLQLPATLYKYDMKKDLAVLELKCNKVLPTCILSLTKYYTLDNVFSASYPQGRGLVITYGHVQHKWGGRILCTANVFPGSSGGGVFASSSGKLIGITSNIGVYFVEPHGSAFLITYLHYFIPIENIIEWLREIKLYA